MILHEYSIEDSQQSRRKKPHISHSGSSTSLWATQWAKFNHNWCGPSPLAINYVKMFNVLIQSVIN